MTEHPIADTETAKAARKWAADPWQDAERSDRPARGIHTTAVVYPGARLGADVEIGPGAIIGADVELGDRVRIGPRAIVTGWTRVGNDTRIWPGAIVGEEPQDHGYEGGRSYVDIGPGCNIREFVTIHRGTDEGSTTEIGPDCMLMATAHVAHNCRLGAGVTLVNGVLLAGHVEVDTGTIISGHALVHQYVRIGAGVMVRGGAHVPRDVPPHHMLVDNSRIAGLNWVGLRRRGISREARRELRTIYNLLHDDGRTFDERLRRLRRIATTEEGLSILSFVESPTRRGYCRA